LYLAPGTTSRLPKLSVKRIFSPLVGIYKLCYKYLYAGNLYALQRDVWIWLSWYRLLGFDYGINGDTIV
jgi:hypothetical protein